MEAEVKAVLSEDEIFDAVVDEIHKKYPRGSFTLPFTWNDRYFAQQLTGIETKEELLETIDEAYYDDVRDAQFDIVIDAIEAAFPDGEIDWFTIPDGLDERLLEYAKVSFLIEPPIDEILEAVKEAKAKAIQN